MYRTERLHLRPSRTDDASAVLAAIGDQDIVRNLGSAPWPYTLADAEQFVAAAFNPEEPRLLAFHGDERSQVLVGVAGLDRMPGGEVELGYWIAKSHWGQGLATELGARMIGIARDELKLTRLTAGYFIDNPASGRVLAKLGFRPIADPVHRKSRAREEMALCQMCALEI